jgi:hypothetical protein
VGSGPALRRGEPNLSSWREGNRGVRLPRTSAGLAKATPPAERQFSWDQPPSESEDHRDQKEDGRLIHIEIVRRVATGPRLPPLLPLALDHRKDEE